MYESFCPSRAIGSELEMYLPASPPEGAGVTDKNGGDEDSYEEKEGGEEKRIPCSFTHTLPLPPSSLFNN